MTSLEKALTEVGAKVEVKAKTEESERRIQEVKEALVRSISKARKLIKELNSFKKLGYSTISEIPPVRVSHTIASMQEANRRVNVLMSELQRELDDRNELERMIFLEDAIKKCPSGRNFIEIVDKLLYCLPYQERQAYLRKRDRCRAASATFNGKLVAVFTTPEQLEKLLERKDWGFNPLNTETRYF